MIKVSTFITQVQIPLNQHWGYIYGNWYTYWTAAKQSAAVAQKRKNWQKTKAYGSQWIGHIVTDCSGLVRWACNQLGEKVAHHSHYLYTDYCRNKGKLINGRRADGTLPRAGSLVFLTNAEGKKHHVGVYIGDDTVIQAKGTQWGVVTSKLSHWDSWGQLKCIDYEEKQVIPEPTPAPAAKQYAKAVNPGSWLRIRQGPNSSAQIVGRMPRGATVIVLDKNNAEWWHIQYENIVGYSASQFLEIVKGESN